MALTDDLTAGYNLDGNSTDVLGANNGTDTNISYSAGKVGDAADFNSGSPSKIVLPSSVLISSTAFSISFWFKTSTTTAQLLIDNDVFPSIRCYAIRISETVSGKLSIYRFNTSQGFINEVFHAGSGYADGNWHHAVFTFSTTNGVRIYVDNGSPTTNADTTANYAAGSNNTTFGQNVESSGGAFNGSMDMVYFWDRELTSTEVSELWNGGAGLQYPFVASTFQASPLMHMMVQTGGLM